MARRGRPTGATGPVLGRALRLLDTFGPTRPMMTLSQIARQAGLPLSTAHRLLGELVAWGALERDEAGCYRIGLRLWELAALAPRSTGLRERALPFLEDLSQVTRENVQLAVREGTEVVYIERIAGSGAVPVLTRVGGRFALTATGVGLVLLAHAPVDVQEQVLAGPITRYTECTMTAPHQIRASLAAPIHDAQGDVVAAVSLVVHHGGASTHALATLLRTSARAISRALPPIV